MLFLHFFGIQKTIWAIIFCIVFLGLTQQKANACNNFEQKRHILLEHKPELVKDANFIGRVEIQEIKQKGVAVALLLESQTHPHQIGKRVTIAYNDGILCGNKLEIGNTGFIIGKSTEMANFDTKVLLVRPYTTKEEKILIYCFKGHRDNIYAHSRANNCSSNL